MFTTYTPQQRCIFGTVWVVQIMALCEAMMERSFDLRWIQHDGIHLPGFANDLLNSDLLHLLLSAPGMG